MRSPNTLPRVAALPRKVALGALFGLTLWACGGSAPAPLPAPAPVAPVAAAPTPAAAPMTAAPTGSKVVFASPADKAEVSSPVHVVMHVEGLTVQPAGEVVAGTGHHHLIIDGVPVPLGEVVPKDAQHIHFGKGDTETDLELSPGTHTVTMQFADGTHRSYGPELATTITLNVTGAATPAAATPAAATPAAATPAAPADAHPKHH